MKISRIVSLASGFLVTAFLIGAGQPCHAQSAFSFAVPVAGCWQSHCTQDLSSNSHTAPPLGTVAKYESYVDSNGVGSGAGLGCSSNLSLVACSLSSDFSAVRIFNADGTAVINGSISPFDSNAARSAPIVFADGGVLEADDRIVAYRPPNGGVTGYDWYPANKFLADGVTPDIGYPISPALVGSNIIFLAEQCVSGSAACGISTFMMNANNGAPVDNTVPNTFLKQTAFAYLFDSSGVQYQTANTPVVDSSRTPARVYVLAEALCKACGFFGARKEGIFAVDIDSTGAMVNAPTMIFAFSGPSGSSPVLIKNFQTVVKKTSRTGNALFFDGVTFGSGTTPPASSACLATSVDRRVRDKDNHSGCFYGILDDGKAGAPPTPATALWANAFPNAQFQAAAAVDPRGGVWVFPIDALDGKTCSQLTQPAYNNCLIRLDPQTGQVVSTQNPVDLTVAINDGVNTYGPSSAMMMSTTGSIAGGNLHVYLTVGAFSLTSGGPPHVVTVDVTGSSPVTAWVTPTDPEGFSSSTLGQFAFVAYTDSLGVSHQGIVFTGISFGPYFFGS